MSGHSRRVADLARKLAIKMGLSAHEQQDIFFAGLLHDIGKIGFSDTLLTKPVSRMSGDELGHYRKHVVAGEAALMPLDDLKEVSKIIRAHHERFDGQGFPDGLEGLAVPFGARILSIVNDYDGLQIGTLADKRMTPEEAKAMLVQSRGKRYDPQVVDAFVELLGGLAHEVVKERLVPYMDLKVGMVLSRDLVSREGVLLLSSDFVLDLPLIKQIHDYAHRENQGIAIYIRTDKQ
jgi:response regulator RpfG family c-di-GMP phosphodiesterase